ncbi:MAG: HutD family protein [Planctomycetes bacterium]|nr:HutD family protein [Planctomycetota bacterium]
MSRVRLIPVAAQRRVPWKNGLGVTREVAVSPEDADVGERFRWRVSLATVERSCPFSEFHGYERTLLLLSGDGLALDFGEAAPPRTLTAPLEPCTFQGEWRTTCRLVGGPVEDLNVMTDRTRAAATVEVVRAAVARDLDGEALVVVAAQGGARVTVAGQAHALAAGDALRVDGRPGVVDLAPEGALVLAVFSGR